MTYLQYLSSDYCPAISGPTIDSYQTCVFSPIHPWETCSGVCRWHQWQDTTFAGPSVNIGPPQLNNGTSLNKTFPVSGPYTTSFQSSLSIQDPSYMFTSADIVGYFTGALGVTTINNVWALASPMQLTVTGSISVPPCTAGQMTFTPTMHSYSIKPVFQVFEYSWDISRGDPEGWLQHTEPVTFNSWGGHPNTQYVFSSGYYLAGTAEQLSGDPETVVGVVGVTLQPLLPSQCS
jgi:hypothetical protein